MRPSIFNIIAQALGNGQGTGAGKFGPSGSLPANLPAPMLGIPGMGGGGGRGGFLSRGAGQQGGMSPITQTVLGKEAEKRRQQAMKLQEKARVMEQEAQELEMPKRQRPVNDTEAGIGSLLMLLAGALGGGQGASEFADGFMRSRQQGAARTDEENLRRYDQQRRSMQIGAGNEMERAKMEFGEAERIEGRVDTEQERMRRAQDIEDQRAYQKQMADTDFERDMLKIDKTQSELNKRAELRDPRKVEAFKALGKTPEGRAKLAELAGLDADAAEAARQLTIQEQNVQAKTQTENDTRPLKVQKLEADIQKVLGSAKLDEIRGQQIRQRISYYPQEFQLKVANTYSLIHQRSKGKVGTTDSYYGKGDETAIRSGMNSAKKTMDAIATKARNGLPVTAEEQEALKVAQADYELFSRELGKVKDAKTDRVRNKYGGPQIDTSGGFAPVNPMKVDTTLPKTPAGAQTPAKSAPKTATRTVNVGGTTVKVYPKKGK